MPTFRRTLISSLLATTLVTTSSMALAEKFASYPNINLPTDPAKQAQVKRGEYLAKAGDCIACHTDAKGGKPYSGGLPIATPFGTFYSPNITPDRATGIGDWTNAEFINAMHNGIRPDGSNNFPVFPFLWYTKVSDQDLLDIRAYLNAIPAVERANHQPDTPFPFGMRILQTFWKLMFFVGHKGVYKPDPTQSHQWNRGAYLVEGLAHCGMCHTPINPLGGPKRDYAFTGNMVGGMLAPNISGAALKNVPTSKIVAVFTQDQLLNGGQVAGPMLEANHDSFQYLTPDDLEAIAVYMKSTQSKQPPKAEIASGADTGKSVYDSSCYACHNSGAAGAPVIGSSADWAPRIKTGMDSLYKNALVGIGAMPAMGNCSTCTDQQIKAAVDYIVQNSTGEKANAVSSSFGKPDVPPKALTMTQGKQIYATSCAVCHDQGANGAPKLGDQQVWAPRIQQGMPTLIEHSISGYGGMPANGSCMNCNNAEIKAAVKYMVEESKTEGNYSLW